MRQGNFHAQHDVGQRPSADKKPVGRGRPTYNPGEIYEKLYLADAGT